MGPVHFTTLIRRALRKKCPQCGTGDLYIRWNEFNVQCPSCGCELEQRAEHSWFFTYMSTAFLTGIIVLWMLFFPFQNHFLGYSLEFLVWLLLILFTLPYRKALAIAIDYWLEKRF